MHGDSGKTKYTCISGAHDNTGSIRRIPDAHGDTGSSRHIPGARSNTRSSQHIPSACGNNGSSWHMPDARSNTGSSQHIPDARGNAGSSRHIPGTHSNTGKTSLMCILGASIMAALAMVSLFVGKYPLSIRELMDGNELQWRVFLTLRASRTLVGAFGGFTLGASGFVYQTVFCNPLASPDIIGVSSGASAGAAAGILFLSGAAAVTASSFAGALLAVVIVLGLSTLDRSGKKSTIVLAGIAVHSLAQTMLMCLKLTADPERQLASIEYWIMGSLNGTSGYSMVGNMLLCILCMGILFPLHRQIILLSGEEGEARMLGVSVGKLRLFVLLTATLAVSAVISLTGLISFIGLLAPHGARLLTKNNRQGTMLLGGLLGGILLIGADILARSVAATELPVSIFTSLLGAPFLILLIYKSKKNQE